MRLHVNRIWTNSYLSSIRCISTKSNGSRKAISEKNASVNALVYTSEAVHTTRQDLPLHNVTIAIKDNICTAFAPTTCSSGMLQGSPSFTSNKVESLIRSTDFTSPFSATVVKLLQDAGADIVGKTNCDEFGMGHVLHFLYKAHLFIRC